MRYALGAGCIDAAGYDSITVETSHLALASGVGSIRLQRTRRAHLAQRAGLEPGATDGQHSTGRPRIHDAG